MEAALGRGVIPGEAALPGGGQALESLSCELSVTSTRKGRGVSWSWRIRVATLAFAVDRKLSFGPVKFDIQGETLTDSCPFSADTRGLYIFSVPSRCLSPILFPSSR